MQSLKKYIYFLKLLNSQDKREPGLCEIQHMHKNEEHGDGSLWRDHSFNNSSNTVWKTKQR